MKPPQKTKWIAVAISSFSILSSQSSALDHFEKKVRPILIEHCYECHSTQSGKSKGGLLLDSKKGWMKGGDLGTAIVPGDSESSLLVRAISYSDPDLEMPPSGKLPSESIEAIQDWIRSGAIDPRGSNSESNPESNSGEMNFMKMNFVKGKAFWAFQPMKSSPFPAVKNVDWIRNEIDYFILSRLEKSGIEPNPPVEDHSLIRRLYIDLIGLPPTLSQIENALAIPSEKRISVLVDRLLASKHFGETWARHWLDLARYAESTGGGRSAILPDAWRYRNYVIDAFNEDKPFDHFLKEQLAGDLLPFENEAQRARQLIATAFLVLGPKNLDLQDKELLRMNTVDEQIDTIGRVFMGMSLGCARCHDHKFDPISAKDYYALAGIFRSTRTLKRSNVSTLTLLDLPTSPSQKRAFNEFSESKKSLEMQLRKLKNQPEKADQLNMIKARLKDHLSKSPSPLPKTLGVSDEDETGNYHLCIRGNVHHLGEEIPRGFIRVMMNDEGNPSISKGESGRRELAEWLSNPDHPLVSRVIVNRVWAHLFGEGIVRTPDNFGTQGVAPTHPDLLDYLALQFIKEGWSIKSLIRRLTLSQTYRLASSHDSKKSKKDEGNRLFWRMPLKSLNAEALRDSVLMISGSLDDQRVECLFPKNAREDTALQKASLDLPSLLDPPFRSIYIPVLREEGLNPMLRVFDFANPSFPVGRRHRSILPTQALFLMNSEFIFENAKKAAKKLINEIDHDQIEISKFGIDESEFDQIEISKFRIDDSEIDESEFDQIEFDQVDAMDLTKVRIDAVYLQTLCRLPSENERALARGFLEKSREKGDEESAWMHLFHSIFASVDFRFMR